MSFSMPSEVMYGSIPVSTKTAIGQELWSHERKPGYDPKQNPFPKMLYKAYKDPNSLEIKCLDVYPKSFLYPNQDMYRMACEAVDNFNLSCQLTIGLNPDNGPAELKEALANGWRESVAEAKEFVKKIQLEMAAVASEEAYKRQKMSDKAKAEWDAEEAKTPDIITDIPIKPTEKKLHWKTAKKLAENAKVSA